MGRILRASIVALLLLGTGASGAANSVVEDKCPDIVDTNRRALPVTDADYARRIQETNARYCNETARKKLGLYRGRMELFSSPNSDLSKDSDFVGSTDGRSIKLDLRW